MDLRHVRYFVAVAECAGVSAAAHRLRITQPALSRQIRDLERELRIRLFDRIGRRMVLTAEGEDLLARSRDLLGLADSFVSRAEAIGGGRTGMLRVGATPQTLESVLPGFLRRYRRLRPGIEVRLVEDGGPGVLARLERGEVHLGITVAGRPNLATRLLFPARVLAIFVRSHRLRRRRTLDVSELAGEPLLLLRGDFASRQWFDAACHAAHVRPHVVLESGAPHTLIALARTGHGIAIAPSNLRFAPSGLRVAAVLGAGKSIGGWLAVNWDPRRFLPSYAKDFVEELAASTRRSYPGRQFEHGVPAVPRPVIAAGRLPG